MSNFSILFLSLVLIASFIASCDARSRSDLQRALGRANMQIHREQQNLNKERADCAKFRASLDNLLPMSDSY